ncbi:MAG: hypothetical protein J2P30_07945, partial [Actinobacteria bacterium]|nr:hypothetical protein [Actinomycetota bacterium]
VGAGGAQLGNLEAGALGSLTSPVISALSGGLATIAGAVVIGLALPAFTRYRRQPDYPAGDGRPAGEARCAGEDHSAGKTTPPGQTAPTGKPTPRGLATLPDMASRPLAGPNLCSSSAC